MIQYIYKPHNYYHNGLTSFLKVSLFVSNSEFSFVQLTKKKLPVLRANLINDQKSIKLRFLKCTSNQNITLKEQHIEKVSLNNQLQICMYVHFQILSHKISFNSPCNLRHRSFIRSGLVLVLKIIDKNQSLDK